MEQDLNDEFKKQIFQSIVLYGREIQPMTKAIRDKIRTEKVDFLRRTLQITKEDKGRTARIQQEMEIASSTTINLENHALKWYRYIGRMLGERSKTYSIGGQVRSSEEEKPLKWKTHRRGMLWKRKT